MEMQVISGVQINYENRHIYLFKCNSDNNVWNVTSSTIVDRLPIRRFPATKRLRKLFSGCQGESTSWIKTSSAITRGSYSVPFLLSTMGRASATWIAAVHGAHRSGKGSFIKSRIYLSAFYSLPKKNLSETVWSPVSNGFEAILLQWSRWMMPVLQPVLLLHNALQYASMVFRLTRDWKWPKPQTYFLLLFSASLSCYYTKIGLYP